MSNNKVSFHTHQLSRIGFGCWQLAGDYTIDGHANGYGATNVKEATMAIHMALDNGINFFDTATGYGFGRSEEVLGQALKSYSTGNTQPLVCSKFAMAEGSRESASDYSAHNLVNSVNASLKRLQTDCLGAMLLHNPPDDFDFTSYDTAPFDQLIQQGKILSYGVSCRSMKGVANVLNSGFGIVIEGVYNPLDRRYAGFFSDPVYNSKYLFICRVPLASGFLSRATLAGARTFASNDIRHRTNEEQAAWVTDAVRKLSFLDDMEGGITVSALRFQLSHSYPTITIPGIRNVRQASDAALALQLGPLPTDIITAIAAAVPDVFYKWK